MRNDDLRPLLRELLNSGGTLESTDGNARIDRDALKRAIAARIGRDVSPGAAASEVEIDAAASNATAAGLGAFEKLEGGASPASLSDHERASLEAIIEVTGRPALRFPDGKVEMPDKLGANSRWRVLVATSRSKIDGVAASVCRIARANGAADGQVLGTGWRVGADRIVTNRHVVEKLVVDPTLPKKKWTLDTARPARANFGATDGSQGGATFSMDALTFCAEDVDLAVVRLGGTAKLPPPLTIRWAPDSLGRRVPIREGKTEFRGEEVYVFGHPWRPGGSAAIRSVFGTADGTKRCSPGKVIAVVPRKRTFTHDCSTLGGSSGSCVVHVSLYEVVGLHSGSEATAEQDLFGRGTANVAVMFAALKKDHPVRLALSA